MSWSNWSVLLADEQAQSLLQRLDPATRAKVLATFAGLLILGFTMLFLTWLGARVARRYGRRRFGPTPPPGTPGGK